MRQNRDKNIIDILSKIAEAVEPVGKARLAAAVVIGKDIISIGVNKRKSHPFQLEHSTNPDCIYLHAENAAILSASKVLRDKEWRRARLYVCRMKWTNEHKKNMVVGNACPCNGCWSAIRTYNPMSVTYTTEDDRQFKTIYRNEFAN